MKSLLAPTAVLGLGLASFLSGHSGGITPGYFGIPANITRSAPGCGPRGCHDGAPNSHGVVVPTLRAATTSLDPGATVTVTVAAAGGVQSPPDKGGLCLETSAGAFNPAGNTDNGRDPGFNPIATILTHTDEHARSWSFTYTAPTSPGAVEWHLLVNTVDFSHYPFGDSWTWWAPATHSGQPGIPYRLYVNATGVTAFGSGCDGTSGLAPVIGSDTRPALGQPLQVHTHNIPFGAPILSVLGVSNTTFLGIPLPLPLDPLGAVGCALRVGFDVFQVSMATGGSPALPGGGVASTAWPIPNDPSLHGSTVYFQSLVVDLTANAAGLTASAGLAATIP